MDKRLDLFLLNASSKLSSFLCRGQQAIARPALALSISLGMAAAWGGVTQPARAAVTTFTFDTLASGTAPFDNNNNPGNDRNATNSIVRTLDVITYEWVVATDTNDTDNVVFTTTLTGDQEWISIPSACQEPGSGISPDGKVLTCDLETVASSLTAQITAQARVRGEAPNGSTLTASTQLTADPGQLLNAGPETNTVSAAPKVDLRKDDANPELIGLRAGPSGEDGLVYSYPLTLVVDGGKGSELLVGDINLTDTISYDNANPVNARLYKGWALNNDAQNGCNWNGPASATGINPESQIPYGKLSAVPVGQEDRAVGDSGTWTCTQTAPGGPISILIEAPDLTGNQRPSLDFNGNALEADETVLVSGVIMLWVPLTDINAAGGSLDLTNTFSTLDNQSISNSTNQEPDTNNNSTTHTIVAGAGSFNNFYWNDTTSSANNNPLPTLTQKNGGNGLVMPTQTFAKWLISNNNGAIPWTSYVHCDKIDNTTHVVTDIDPINDPGNAVNVIVRRTTFSDFVVEYGTGGYADFTDQRNTTCEDADSPDGWFTSTTDVPGGAGAITKVRVRATQPVPAPTRFEIGINLTALNNDPDTGNLIENGTLLANHSAVQINELSNGNWRTSNYNPITHGGSKAFGDRLTLTRAITRIDKTTSPNDSVDSIDAGDPVVFSLDPTITATVDPAPVNPNVIITDTLPKEFTFQAGSASITPTSVTVNGDDTTTIVWDLGPRQPNIPIAPITFSAVSKFDTPDATTAVNEVVISSPDDASAEEDRTDTRAVTIGNFGSFRIFKSTPTPEVPVDTPITFSLLLANLSQAFDVQESQFIDILPYNGDGPSRPALNQNGRSPATSFNGTLTFDSIVDVDSIGFEFEFTDADPTTIDVDPSTNTNTWCPDTDFGTPGCPFDKAAVTAIRITSPLFPGGDPSRELTLNLNASGNLGGDIYTNDFYGLPQGLGFIPSQDAVVEVPIVTDFGDAPDSYGDASHNIRNVPTLFLGTVAPDGELDTLLGGDGGAGADGDDDATSPPAVDDEDGISTFPTISTNSTDYSLTLTVNNGSLNPANVYAWIDFDRDGEFDEDERATVSDSSITLVGGQVPGATGGTVELNWSNLGGTGADLDNGDSFVRVRITTDELDTTTETTTQDDASIGEAFNGEVEDFPLPIIDGGMISPAAGQIVINEVLFRQSGGTSANNNDEFIELFNASNDVVDISGWQLLDGNLLVDDTDGIGGINGNSGPFVFPAGTVLNPGDYVVVWVGNDTGSPDKQANDAAFQFYLGQGVKLNNDGDDVWLYDTNTDIVDYIAYGSGSSINTPPEAPLNLWDDTYQSVIDNTSQAGQSISLTPNGQDGNTSGCWEPTTSDDADDPSDRCPGFLPTRDTDSVTGRITSVGVSNNGFPLILLVKRITAVNGNDLTGFDGNDGRTDDDNPNWPTPKATYLRGAVSSGTIAPGDEVEFTIYFLSTGGSSVTNLKLCDLVPANTVFNSTAFNGLSPLDANSLPGTDVGIALASDNSALPDTPTVYLTNLAEGDRGEFIPPATDAPAACNESDFSQPLPAIDNPKGAVVVDVVRSPDELPNATGAGTPTDSYGFIRFRATVD